MKSCQDKRQVTCLQSYRKKSVVVNLAMEVKEDNYSVKEDEESDNRYAVTHTSHSDLYGKKADEKSPLTWRGRCWA